MANVCSICGKKTVSGNNVSHANNRTKRQFKPNLKRRKVIKDGKVSFIKICTKCIKSGKMPKEQVKKAS